MGKKLFIIGNGFDCMYGLPTGVSDFEEQLSQMSVYNETDNANEVLNTYGVYWNEFENGLADIDIDEIVDRNMEYPDYLSDRESDRDGGILNMQMYTESLNDAVSGALNNMIENAEDELYDKSCITEELFHEGDQIVTFNYTSTIERLYELPEGTKICHIHGDTSTNKVFGYGKPQVEIRKPFSSEEDDYYVGEQRRVANSFYKGLQKDYQFERLKKFLCDECTGIKEVVVIGHSMADVDAEYMEIIDDAIKPKKWKVSQYKSNPDKNTLNEYSFADRIETFDSEDILKRY